MHSAQRLTLARSLDIGCGAAPDFPPADIQVGLDISFDSLVECRRSFPNAHYVCGDGEHLPFRDASFDAVVSRVALPLMNLNAAIPEISRVTNSGGRVTLNLHHFEFTWRDFLRRLRSGRPRAIAGGAWALLNGFIFHFFGRTIRMPFSTRFYDSFQTYTSMKRILLQQGFASRVIEAYVIKAQKPASAENNEKQPIQPA